MRGIAAISMVEAIVPAAGPLLGALVLELVGWRGIFWTLAVVTLAVLPFATRASPKQLPDLDRSMPSSYRALLASSRYVRLALSHALAMGALLTFIASAPQLLARELDRGPGAFALLQAVGVAAFLVFASQAGRISKRLSAGRAVQVGAVTHGVLCGALLVASEVAAPSLPALCAFWFIFCGTLAVRGPTAMSEALDVPAAQLGRASALLVLALLAMGALGTQLVAPFLDGESMRSLAAVLAIMCALSAALVMPYPRAPSGS